MKSAALVSTALLALTAPVSPLAAQEAQRGFTIAFDSVAVALELEGPAVVALSDEIRRTAEATFAYHVQLYGSLPAAFTDGSLERVSIAIAEGGVLRGESEPGRVDMTMPPPETPLDHLLWKGVLAHEIFHLWNAEGFRYATVEEQWLSEGFTQYYTLRTLARMGVLDAPTFLDFLGRILGMYLTDPGLGSMSMREAGPVKAEHTGLVEGGGLAAALCLDVELRTSSGGQRSLDDLMRLFFVRHDAADRRYDFDDVMRAFAEIRGEDRGEFFRAYVAGTATLPLDECLAPAGLSLRMEEGAARITSSTDATESQRSLFEALRIGSS